MNPFDAYVAETRRWFWEEPEVTEYSAANVLTIDWAAARVFRELSDEQVLQVLGDLYLRREELDVDIRVSHQREHDRPLLEAMEEAVLEIVIAAATGTLRQDKRMESEDAIRLAAQNQAIRNAFGIGNLGAGDNPK